MRFFALGPYILQIGRAGSSQLTVRFLTKRPFILGLCTPKISGVRSGQLRIPGAESSQFGETGAVFNYPPG